ncbi:hypothetical protein MBLNU459_g7562t1 [Dothideomycetes sp. NU459]
MEDYLGEVKRLFEAPLSSDNLHAMSEELQREFQYKLQSSNICMLPSFNHTLPTGCERGTFLALDVGGSTFRVALVRLSGKDSEKDGMEIMTIRSFAIDRKVRDLKGKSFFDWIAERIEEVLAVDDHQPDRCARPLSMALAWSFPIEQTSTRSGSLLPMGKGFCATHGVEGQDLCELIMHSCRERKLNVLLQALVNDSSATLLSQAYRDPSTRLSLILGTGINSAIYLPVSALSSEKYGDRPQSWYAVAKRVLVNTELSMFGNAVWGSSPWDNHLNATHGLPDFQPLEYKVGGRYLGELVRLILVEAIETVGLFRGQMPAKLQEPYALDTGIVAQFEHDTTDFLCAASTAMQAAHPLPRNQQPSLGDLHFVRSVSKLVSNRAAGYVATAVHALWSLQRTASAPSTPSGPVFSSPSSSLGDDFHYRQSHVTIACNGSVMEKYPDFRARCQVFLNELAVLSGADEHAISIEMAYESSVFGAAVAAASEASESACG